MGGRKLALVSTLILCTMGLFIVEHRQAGNDGPLALFTTLSLYAAWRTLNGPGRRLSPRQVTPHVGRLSRAVATGQETRPT